MAGTETWQPATTILETYVLPILAGLLLAAATGLRAFLPLCVVAWAAHLNFITLNSSFAWLHSLPAVVALTAAVVFEVIGDKFPVVDHLLDVLGTFIKPVAAFFVVAASLSSIDPFYAGLIGILGGSSVATGVHLLKAKGRLVANAASVGLAAPVLSIAEDAITFTTTLAAVFVPLAAIAFVIVLALLLRRRR